MQLFLDALERAKKIENEEQQARTLANIERHAIAAGSFIAPRDLEKIITTINQLAADLPMMSDARDEESRELAFNSFVEEQYLAAYYRKEFCKLDDSSLRNLILDYPKPPPFIITKERVQTCFQELRQDTKSKASRKELLRLVYNCEALGMKEEASSIKTFITDSMNLLTVVLLKRLVEAEEDYQKICALI